MSSSSPAAIFSTRYGSAICARVMPMRSTHPSSTAWRAVGTSAMRVAWRTGIDTGISHRAAEFEEGSRGGAHAGDRFREGAVALDAPAGDGDELDAVLDVALEDRDRVVAVQPVLSQLVHAHPHAHDEVVRHRGSHRVDEAQGEAQAVLERSAVLVFAVVEPRGDEGVHEVAPVLQFEAVQTAVGHPPRRLRVVGDDPVDVPVLGLLREGAVGGLAIPARRYERQPVAGEVRGPGAQMGHLDHDLGAEVMYLVGELPQPRDDVVCAQVDVAERGGGVAGDDGGTADHRESHTAAGLLHVVAAVAVCGHAVVRVRGFV